MAKAYKSKVTPWQINQQDFPHTGSSIEQLKFLLGYAILAPSSHNTQPWKFKVREDEIWIFVDPSRWLKVADADQRELYISVGCILENLLVAAEHFGYEHQTFYCPELNNEELAVIVKLIPEGKPSVFREPTLFEAIPARHTNHKVYEERFIPRADLQFLQNGCVEKGIKLGLIDDPKIKRQVDRLVTCGDAMLFADPAWREELGYWMGQGVFGTSWLMSKLAQLSISHVNLGKGTAKKDSELLMSSPILAILSSETNDRPAQIKVGQIFERICLRAQSLGIRVQPMSQILEVPELKCELAKFISVSGMFPQHAFRLGYAEPEPEHTPRRPLAEALI